MSVRSLGFAAFSLILLGVAGASEGKTAKKHSAVVKPAAIVFSYPADESNVSATVPVRAVASQVDKVHSVTFYLDGDKLTSSEGPGGAFKWDTTKVGDGWHTLSAVAKDATGKTSEADLAVMVHNFVDKVAPKVHITWPMDGDPKSGWMTTRVHATDNIAVSTVETYVDGSLVATSSTAPFDTKWNWSKLSKGEHTLQCIAYDSVGNSSASAMCTITKS